MSAQPGVPLNQPVPNALNSALWRYGGMFGRVLDLNGNIVHEAVQVTSTTTVNQIDVPMVGTGSVGKKPGRIDRTGSIVVQKLDTAWEMRVYDFIRLAGGEGGGALMEPFSIILEHRDPGTLGAMGPTPVYEQWQLDGCLVWALPLGINVGEDLVQNEYPLTWERETPLHAFTRTGQVGGNGLPAIQFVGALDGAPAA